MLAFAFRIHDKVMTVCRACALHKKTRHLTGLFLGHIGQGEHAAYFSAATRLFRRLNLRDAVFL